MLSPLLGLSLTPVSVKRQANPVTTLSPAQINEFAPFTHFASTAYCNPSTTINWSCGGEFTHPQRMLRGILAEIMPLQPTAMRTLTFKQWTLEVMAIVSSFVSKRLTTDVISNNAHNSFPGYFNNSHRCASRNRYHQIVTTSFRQTFFAISLTPKNPSGSPSPPMLIFSSSLEALSGNTV